MVKALLKDTSLMIMDLYTRYNAISIILSFDIE